MSERWSISVAQAKLTLKDTTQRLKQSAVMPFRRRYIEDRMFGVKQLDCIMATDTMHAKNKIIQRELYCQVFINMEFFVKAYPIQKNSDCHEALDGIDQILWSTRYPVLRWCQGTIGIEDRITSQRQ